jgi:hypothetical protein
MYLQLRDFFSNPLGGFYADVPLRFERFQLQVWVWVKGQRRDGQVRVVRIWVIIRLFAEAAERRL